MGIFSDFTTYFLHFDLSEIIALIRYLPITPELPVTSETCPVPLDYSICRPLSHVISCNQLLTTSPLILDTVTCVRPCANGGRDPDTE